MLLKKSDLVHSRGHLSQALAAQNHRSHQRAHERDVAAYTSATKVPSSGPLVDERMHMKCVNVTVACRNHLVGQLVLSKTGEYEVVSGGFESPEVYRSDADMNSTK